jgi:hypothetical protein
MDMVKLLLVVLALTCVACGDAPTSPSANNSPCAQTAHRQYAADGINFTCQPN